MNKKMNFQDHGCCNLRVEAGILNFSKLVTCGSLPGMARKHNSIMNEDLKYHSHGGML
jgi:hypothetical protein